jgi:hypothetical protein
MFCPDCGTANVKSQKFCTRCGANILAIDRAREIIGDVAAGPTVNQPQSTTILKIVALISIFGFLFITSGTVFLALIDDGKSAISIGFGVVGFMALVLICRSLLRLASRVEPVRQVIAPSYITPAPPPVRAVTNRRLGEASIAYDSVTEESTRQFESERQGPLR